QFQRAAPNDQRVVGIVDAAADHGVDVYVEVGVFGQHLKFFVEYLETLFRDVVGQDIVDRNLHVIEPGLVQLLDAVRHQQVTVGDHAGQHAAVAHRRDDAVEIGVQ